MPDKITCPTCEGEGHYKALVSQHDDRTETITCPQCGDKGTINVMTESEEEDYHNGYL